MTFSKLVLISSALLIAGNLTSPLFAAQSVQKVKVELAGEADQPMSIVIDQSTLKAGIVEFDVANTAIGTDHEMVLVKVASADIKLISGPKSHRVDEHKLKSLGEVAGLKAGHVDTLTVKLVPGDYMLICNHKFHFELGMATHLTVTQ